MWSASSTACRPTTSWSILAACRPCLVPPNLLLPQNMRWQSWHDKLYEPPCCRWTCSTISTDTRWDQIWPIREWKHNIWRYDMTRILEEPVQYPHEYWLVQYHFVCQGASALAMGRCEMVGERGARLPAKNFPQMAGHIDSGPKHAMHTMHTMHTSNLHANLDVFMLFLCARIRQRCTDSASIQYLPSNTNCLLNGRVPDGHGGEGFWLPARWIRRKSDALHNSSTKKH